MSLLSVDKIKMESFRVLGIVSSSMRWVVWGLQTVVCGAYVALALSHRWHRLCRRLVKAHDHWSPQARTSSDSNIVNTSKFSWRGNAQKATIETLLFLINLLWLLTSVWLWVGCVEAGLMERGGQLLLIIFIAVIQWEYDVLHPGLLIGRLTLD